MTQSLSGQLTLEGTTGLDLAAIVAATCAEVARGTIDIPRVSVTPDGAVETGFNAFVLDTGAWHYQPLTEELYLKHLRTNQVELVTLSTTGIKESRLENYVVACLIDFDDVSYDAHADLLYDLASQAVAHFRGYLSEEDTERWCQRASEHTVKHGDKPWKYALVPHDVVDENMSLEFLVRAGVSA